MSIRSLNFLVLIGILASACGKKDSAPQGPPPVAVAVEPVTATQVSYYDEYPAIVKALNEVELRAQINGYITGIHFQEGQKVKKGQQLYSIDQQQSQAAYNQALANLSVQEANLLRAKKDVERYRELDKSDAIAKQQVDYAEATYTAAQQQVEAAKASVRNVQTNVRYSTIVAPFDGTIGISLVKLGASVSPGVTLLNTISSDDPVAADFTIDQKELYKFSQLLTQKRTKSDSTFRLFFGTDVYQYPGALSVIDRAVDAQTGSIKVRVTFPNPKHELRPGMSGRVGILSASGDKTVTVPMKAITEQLGEFFVYVADSAKVTQRKVLLGKQINRNIIVRDGLKEGETIVTEGIQNLREGSAIRIAENKK